MSNKTMRLLGKLLIWIPIVVTVSIIAVLMVYAFMNSDHLHRMALIGSTVPLLLAGSAILGLHLNDEYGKSTPVKEKRKNMKKGK